MNRFLPKTTLAGALRCACGLLGCATVSLGTTSAAAATNDPPMPSICRQASEWGGWNDRQTQQMCEEAWQALYGTPPAQHQDHSAERRANRPSIPRKPIPPVPLHKPSPRPSHSTPTRQQASKIPSSTPPPPAPRADAETSETTSLQPLLLIGLLLMATAAIGYPLRRRIYALAGSALLSPALSPDPETEQTVHFTYRPAIDPFAFPAIGLTGPGAADAARVMTLTALEEYAEHALVVIPRADATAVFGLSDDELLDETTAGLFIPGNLDAALASIETELAVRRDAKSHDRQAPRLLLVADCEKEPERIQDLLARHRGELSALLLGDWPADRVSVDEDGLVTASAALAGHLPERLPAMSRTEARDRLNAALGHHGTRRGAHTRRRRRTTPTPS